MGYNEGSVVAVYCFMKNLNSPCVKKFFVGR